MAQLGEVLIEAGFISVSDLERALASQQQSGRRLGEELVHNGVIREHELAQALATALSVPWVSLNNVEFTRELLSMIPGEVAERRCLVPVYKRTSRFGRTILFVAMAEPTDEAAISEIASICKMPVKPMVAAPTDVLNAVRVYYLGLSPIDPPGAEVVAHPSISEIPEEATKPEQSGSQGRPTALDLARAWMSASTTRDFAADVAAATLLELLLKKGLVSDWEFVDLYYRRLRENRTTD